MRPLVKVVADHGQQVLAELRAHARVERGDQRAVPLHQRPVLRQRLCALQLDLVLEPVLAQHGLEQLRHGALDGAVERRHEHGLGVL